MILVIPQSALLCFGRWELGRAGCIVGQDGGTSQVKVNPTKVGDLQSPCSYFYQSHLLNALASPADDEAALVGGYKDVVGVLGAVLASSSPSVTGSASERFGIRLGKEGTGLKYTTKNSSLTPEAESIQNLLLRPWNPPKKGKPKS